MERLLSKEATPVLLLFSALCLFLLTSVFSTAQAQRFWTGGKCQNPSLEKPLDGTCLWYSPEEAAKHVCGGEPRSFSGPAYSSFWNTQYYGFTCYPGGEYYGTMLLEPKCKSGNYFAQLGNGYGACSQYNRQRNNGRPECGNGTNPVHSATGNKFQEEGIWKSAKFSGFEFGWFYNSDDMAFATYNYRDNKLKRRWFHSYQLAIESDIDRALANPSLDFGVLSAVVKTRDGRAIVFTNSVSSDGLSTASQFWTAKSSNVRSQLSTIQEPTTGHAVGLSFVDTDGITYQFSLEGQLTAVEGKNNQLLTIERSVTGRVSTVLSDFGEILSLIYNGDQLVGIQSSDGEVVNFEFDVNSNLSSVIYPDQTPADGTDNPRRVYLYEDSRFPSHLTGIIDERGNRVATWVYDDQGRAIASEHAGGVDNHTLVYNADGTTTVTDPQGRARTYSFTNQSGVIKVASITGGDCAHCGGDAASYTYDANGHMASKTDFNGNVTLYTRDDKGRELTRTEASGTPEERVITTTWHADVNKPLTVTEPGRLTTYTYDPDGRLLTQTEQAQP